MNKKPNPILWCFTFVFALLLFLDPATHASGVRTGNKVKQEFDVDTFPIPTGVENLLFYIQRDPNTNTIVYTLNVDANGRLNQSNPIHPFWIRYPEGGERKDLNFIQRKFAYGINSKKTHADQFDIRSVAYNKLPLNLKKDSKGKFHVYASINNQEAVLERIFIRIGDGGTFWKPDVKYIELKGVHVATGKRVLQRFKP